MIEPCFVVVGCFAFIVIEFYFILRRSAVTPSVKRVVSHLRDMSSISLMAKLAHTGWVGVSMM